MGRAEAVNDAADNREIAARPVDERLRGLVRVGAVDPSWTGSTVQAFTPLLMEAADEIARLRSALRLAQFKVDILTNNEAVHLERLRKVDPEWVAAEARIAETEAWWEANGHAELVAHLRERGLTITGGEAQ